MPDLHCPEYIRKALVKHDWRLRMAWNPRKRKWEILRLMRVHQTHPPDAFNGHGRRNRAYWFVANIQDDFGNPRVPCWNDVVDLRSGDWENRTPKQVLDGIEKANDKRDADLDKQWSEAMDPLAEYAADAFTSKTRVGHEPKGSRRW